MNFGYTSFFTFYAGCYDWLLQPFLPSSIYCLDEKFQFQKKKKKLRRNFVKLISRKLYFFEIFILFGNLVLVVSEKMAWNIEWVIGSFVETLHVGERALMAPSSRARISIWPHCFVQIIARSSGVIFDRRLQSG